MNPNLVEMNVSRSFFETICSDVNSNLTMIENKINANFDLNNSSFDVFTDGNSLDDIAMSGLFNPNANENKSQSSTKMDKTCGFSLTDILSHNGVDFFKESVSDEFSGNQPIGKIKDFPKTSTTVATNQNYAKFI